ncbi:DsbA family protein [Microbacterium excoecariae]|uniref:DsbA family protein n=1 Tax=Microbacterium excoecariae TaxID=2715210 RepID=UPI00140B42A2|nr:thioredoxin domain-containing protein [Microbacterium excoecariae]NHI17858.1 thioredoxin domain-containing protein [Microbacterium excoecariae]
MTNETPELPENSAPGARREALREKATAVKARIRRRRLIRWAVIALVVIVAVGAAAWWIWREVSPEIDRPVVTPNNVTGDAVDMISLLPEEERPETVADPIDIEIYVDYLSPDAGDIEQNLAPAIFELVDEGVVTVAYHPLSLLSGQSNGTQYSARAAGAAMCVVSDAPQAFRAFNTALLTNQPEPDTDGYTDEELADLAEESGAEDLGDCIADHTYTPWVSEATARALDGELPGTDGVALTGDAMVLVDGMEYEGAFDDAAEFSQFLLTVQSELYYGDTGDSADAE